MEKLVDDMFDQILARLEVKYIIRCKSVCKSWHSYISKPRFVKAHLHHTYNNDLNINNKYGHRRIGLYRPCYSSLRCIKNSFIGYKQCNLIGSSNGLVCMYTSRGHLFVANPSTREVKQLGYPGYHPDINFCDFFLGFGYDSSTDDFKVISGFKVLTLRTNVWKDLRRPLMKYTSITSIGILCNGALHWFMLDQNKKKVLISFDLSKNEFKEIPQPDDPRYDSKSFQDLGIINGCLCIFKLINLSNVDLNWVMKKYNVKQSWELLQYERSANNDNQNDVTHYLKPADSYYIPHTSFFTTPITYLSCEYLKIWSRAAIPVFVQSLVSPHIATKRRLPNKRKRER